MWGQNVTLNIHHIITVHIFFCTDVYVNFFPIISSMINMPSYKFFLVNIWRRLEQTINFLEKFTYSRLTTKEIDFTCSKLHSIFPREKNIFWLILIELYYILHHILPVIEKKSYISINEKYTSYQRFYKITK